MNDYYRRIAVWEDTLKRAPSLAGPPSVKIVHDPGYGLPRPFGTTEVRLVDGDLIDVAREYLRDRPLVHNLADDCFPGGCVNVGSGAAEESLFRRTNYFRSLTLHFYPILHTEAVYSPRITVFKEGEDSGFARCEPFQLDFVACPGLRHPRLTPEGHLAPEDVSRLETKIETLFQTAHRHGHGVLVLGAMGCGAWKNPPLDVAQAFRRVIQGHSGTFSLVVFAIKRGVERTYIERLVSDRPDNLEAFQSVFEPELTAP